MIRLAGLGYAYMGISNGDFDVMEHPELGEVLIGRFEIRNDDDLKAALPAGRREA